MSRADVKAAALPGMVVVGAALVLARVINAQDPISEWLLWPYLGFVVATLGFGAACLAGGFAIARWAGATTLPMRECLMQSFMLGVLAYAFAIVGVGLVGGLSGVAFVVIPLVFLAVGGRPLARYCRKGARRMRRLAPRAMSTVGVLAAVYAVACLAGLYLNILSPANLAYDARWDHLPNAEHYASFRRNLQ